MQLIEVFSSPGCPRCTRTAERIERLLSETGLGPARLVRVNVLDRLDEAVALGVRATPAIVIDGRLVATGVTDETGLRRLLEETLTPREDPAT